HSRPQGGDSVTHGLWRASQSAPAARRLATGRCTICHLVLERTPAPMRRPLPWVAGLIYVSAASAGGVYEEVPIDKDEWRLIEESKDLEGYFASQSLLYMEPKARELVRRVGHEIRPQPTDDYIEYEFFVLRDPSPNAFALPNGHVYVHTGMLARLDDEDQLAALLAHEINHVAGHHGIIEHR